MGIFYYKNNGELIYKTDMLMTTPHFINSEIRYNLKTASPVPKQKKMQNGRLYYSNKMKNSTNWDGF